MKHKAYDIGIQLGIARSKLIQFEQEEKSRLLSTAVDYWLNGNVPETPVTWHFLVAALRSEQVGETGLAEDISKKYCSQPKNTDANSCGIARF